MLESYINKVYLDRYKITEEVESTSELELAFKGVDLQTDKMVLFRVIPFDKEHPELKEQSQRFIFKELSLLQRLTHEGLPQFLDSYSDRNENVIILSYRTGVPLSDKLKESPVVSEKNTIAFFERLLPILKYLHSQSPPIIYRDLQPKSIYIDSYGNPYLTKYEAARTYKVDKIKDTQVVSTRGYNPPEQALGKGQSDARSDIYSLGMIMFQMLTGKDPTASLILPSVSDIKPDVSSLWTVIVTKATNIKPDKRYASIDDLAADISKIKGSPIDTNRTFAPKLVEKKLEERPTVAFNNPAELAPKPTQLGEEIQKAKVKPPQERVYNRSDADKLSWVLSAVVSFIVILATVFLFNINHVFKLLHLDKIMHINADVLVLDPTQKIVALIIAVLFLVATLLVLFKNKD